MAENRELALCSVCKVQKPRAAFNLSRTITSGISNRCRACNIVYMKDWHARNKNHVQRYAKKYHELNSGKRSELFQAWYSKNREAQREKALSRRNADVERARAKCRDWCNKNKDRRRTYKQDNRLRYRASDQRRRARMRSAEGCWAFNDIEEIFILQDGLCAYCLECLSENFQVDHVIPLAKGGSNWPSNLALACPTCNRKKCARTDMKPFLQVSNG